MDGKAIPDGAASFLSEIVGEGFPAMDVQVIHHHVNCSRPTITAHHGLQRLGKFWRGAVGVGRVKCRPAFGSTTPKTLAVPQRLYSLSRFATRPGAAGIGGRMSACNVTGFSSRQTTGSAGV